MTAAGVFYPPEAGSAEERLQFYASRFPVVEVDATYYALPSRRLSELWVERTPPDFVFDIKAHALLTGQPTETKRLPKAIREALPRDARGQGPRLRQGPARRAPRRGLAHLRGRPRPARRARPAGRRLPPVPEVVLHLVGEPRRDPRGEGRAGAVRAPGRRRVPQRDLVQREERRADAPLPRGRGHPARDGRRAAGVQVVGAAGRRHDVEGPRGRPVPRPAERDLGGHEGPRDRRALPLPL